MDLTRPFIRLIPKSIPMPRAYKPPLQAYIIGLLVSGVLLVGLVGCATGTSLTPATPTSNLIVPQTSPGASEPQATLVQPRERQLQQQQQPQATPTSTTTPIAFSQVSVGNTVEINTTTGAVQVSFTIDRPQFVNVLARSVDGSTNPVMLMYAAGERLIAFSDDHISKRTDLQTVDAMIEDAYLIAGTYSVRIENSGGGDGRVNVGLETASGGVLGSGQQTILRASLQPQERFVQRLNLNANEVISLTVISEAETFDPRIRLERADGQMVAKNDDTDSFDIVLSGTDAKIENFIVPAMGEYVAEIRGFSLNDTGTFQFIITRYGTLEPVEPPVIELTGKILHRQRLEFPLELQAGEFISVTATADNSQVDPAITLLDADNIILFTNDDHNTNTADLGQFDARVSNFVIPSTGAHLLNLESVSGRGGYRVVIQRFGKLNPEAIGAPIDTSANAIIPPPATPAPPEVTAEATPR